MAHNHFGSRAGTLWPVAIIEQVPVNHPVQEPVYSHRAGAL
jgi:hypothetical protein